LTKVHTALLQHPDLDVSAENGGSGDRRLIDTISNTNDQYIYWSLSVSPDAANAAFAAA
jgi:hypothetical protein